MSRPQADSKINIACYLSYLDHIWLLEMQVWSYEAFEFCY